MEQRRVSTVLSFLREHARREKKPNFVKKSVYNKRQRRSYNGKDKYPRSYVPGPTETRSQQRHRLRLYESEQREADILACVRLQNSDNARRVSAHIRSRIEVAFSDEAKRRVSCIFEQNRANYDRVQIGRTLGHEYRHFLTFLGPVIAENVRNANLVEKNKQYRRDMLVRQFIRIDNGWLSVIAAAGESTIDVMSTRDDIRGVARRLYTRAEKNHICERKAG